MKLVPVALMYLGTFAFLGADTAQLDVASEFRKKLNQWPLNLGKKEFRALGSLPTGLADLKAGPVQAFVQPLDVKSTSGNPQASDPSAARLRVRRYAQRNNLQRPRSVGCRFGTCNMQNLAHQIYHFTDKDKDSSAPPKKMSPQGYGRRRRRALLVAGRARTPWSAESLVRKGPTYRAH